MIKVDFENKTYTCPFCEHDQVYMVREKYLKIGSCVVDEVGFYKTNKDGNIQFKTPLNYLDTEMKVYSF